MKSDIRQKITKHGSLATQKYYFLEETTLLAEIQGNLKIREWPYVVVIVYAPHAMKTDSIDRAQYFGK